MLWLFLGAVNGFLAVAAGAFGAHALKERLGPELLATWETASRYHALHALALVGIGLWARTPTSGDGRLTQVAGLAFTVGVALFSGSLYGLALTGVRSLGAITPVGGVALLTGWACFAIAVFRTR